MVDALKMAVHVYASVSTVRTRDSLWAGLGATNPLVWLLQPQQRWSGIPAVAGSQPHRVVDISFDRLPTDSNAVIVHLASLCRRIVSET